MAKDVCPCGCGKILDKRSRAIVSRAMDLRVAVPILRRFVEVEDKLPPQLRAPLASQWAGFFEWKTDLLYAFGHRDPVNSIDVPGARELRQLQLLANPAIWTVHHLDRPWFDSYVATLPPYHQSQVMGSVAYQDRMHGNLG